MKRCAMARRWRKKGAENNTIGIVELEQIVS